MSNLDTQIKTFLSVARLGSFRRAADELFFVGIVAAPNLRNKASASLTMRETLSTRLSMDGRSRVERPVIALTTDL